MFLFCHLFNKKSLKDLLFFSFVFGSVHNLLPSSGALEILAFSPEALVLFALLVANIYHPILCARLFIHPFKRKL